MSCQLSVDASWQESVYNWITFTKQTKQPMGTCEEIVFQQNLLPAANILFVVHNVYSVETGG